MLKSRLEHLLRGRRDNDVVVGSTFRREVIGVHYDESTDQIVIDVEHDRSMQLDAIDRVRELDRYLSSVDAGNSVWYAQWRTRMSDTLGCLDDELNHRTELHI